MHVSACLFLQGYQSMSREIWQNKLHTVQIQMGLELGTFLLWVKYKFPFIFLNYSCVTMLKDSWSNHDSDLLSLRQQCKTPCHTCRVTLCKKDSKHTKECFFSPPAPLLCHNLYLMCAWHMNSTVKHTSAVNVSVDSGCVWRVVDMLCGSQSHWFSTCSAASITLTLVRSVHMASVN